MIFGDLGGLKVPDIYLEVRKNPEKPSLRKIVPTGDRTRARSVTGAHAIAWPTAVDCPNSPEHCKHDAPVCSQASYVSCCIPN